MTIGHNSLDGNSLKSFVERIERLNEEKAATNADIRDVFYEAKGRGFDTKTIRKVIKERTLSEHERNARDAAFDTYMHAVGEQYELFEGRVEVHFGQPSEQGEAE